MLAEQRHTMILKMVNSSGAISISELADTLNVSAMTVRRDLAKLDDMGLLERTHGGAVPLHVLHGEEAYDAKVTLNHEAKKRIAAAAIKLIKEGDTVYLDAGTTTHEMARLMKGMKNMTVVTNDLRIACHLLDSEVKLIISGGDVDSVTGSTLGFLSEETLKQLRVDVSFLGASSIDDDFNLLTPSKEKASFKRATLNLANKAYLVVDESKFHSQALYKIMNASYFTAVITNKQFSENEKKVIGSKGIEVVIVE